nr:hypothetical protein [Tanacetum cinerariifolium]
MDMSWMYMKDRTSSQFTKGVELFLDLIFLDVGPCSFKKCPYSRCGEQFYKTRDDMKDDLIVGGFLENYLSWSLMHNFETQRYNAQNKEVIIDIERDGIVGMVQDAMGIPNVVKSADVDKEMMDDETSKVFKTLKDEQRPLFKGSTRFTLLYFITRLLHIKVLGGWSNKSRTMVLELFFEALEEIGDASMYKKFNSDKQEDGDDLIPKRKILAKQVHYFPLKPKLKWLFMSPRTASQMTGHLKGRVDDSLMRHPADSPSWKMFDKNYPEFSDIGGGTNVPVE